MAIKEPERIWYKRYSRDEKIWVSVSLLWMLTSFVFMPVYHFAGSQNPPIETYRVKAEDYDKLVDAMIEKFQVGEENGVPVVHPDPDEPVFIKASMWQWYPIVELEKGKTYKIHLSSTDIQHGFSLQPINMNFMVLPDYDYVLTLTPTTDGEFYIVCNEFCGIGHHMMVGKLYVK